MPDTTPNDVHLGTVRRLMLDQLTALRAAKPGADLAEELKRSKGVSEISAVLIESARVEVGYLQATQQSHSGFLDAPDGASSTSSNGITSITRHRLGR